MTTYILKRVCLSHYQLIWESNIVIVNIDKQHVHERDHLPAETEWIRVTINKSWLVSEQHCHIQHQQTACACGMTTYRLRQNESESPSTKHGWWEQYYHIQHQLTNRVCMKIITTYWLRHGKSESPVTKHCWYEQQTFVINKQHVNEHDHLQAETEWIQLCSHKQSMVGMRATLSYSTSTNSMYVSMTTYQLHKIKCIRVTTHKAWLVWEQHCHIQHQQCVREYGHLPAKTNKSESPQQSMVGESNIVVIIL